jgi:two-component system, NarL family, sensor histidine kinase DesK
MDGQLLKPATAAEAEWVASQRKWTQGRGRHFLVAVPLLYLIYVIAAVDQNSRGAGAVTGYVVIAAFAACFLLLPVVLTLESSARRFWTWYAVLAVLFLAELPFARAAAFVFCLYLSIIVAAKVGFRSWPHVVVMALAALFVPVAIPSWHVSFVKSIGDFTPLAIPVAWVVTCAVLEVLRGNQALAEARAEVAQLAAENERIRIARDLHDLLGHSLTTITVKAGLARRLGAADPVRAVGQIAEVEELCRQALTEVRAAVSGYRDVTLAGELARGRELLRAAGVAADLPTATDIVDPAHQELLGWAVREGLTNVVRHSRAGTCAVRLSQSGVEITDDGVGAAAPAGNGLSGLRERVAAAGGSVEAGPVQPSGWRLQVLLAAEGGT